MNHVYARLYCGMVRLSLYYRLIVPSGRGRWRLLKLLRKWQPHDLNPGLIERHGRRWFVSDLRNDAEAAIFYDLAYDAGSFSLVRRCVRQGDHVIDVGGNIGIFTAALAELVGQSGSVLAIEASPIHFEALRRNIELQRLSNVVTVNIAASSHAGEAVHYTTHSSGSLVSDFAEFGMRCQAVNRVQTLPLDDIVPRAGHAEISFIKIDVDGNELDVIRGAHQVIERSRPHLLLEVSERAQRLAGYSAIMLLSELEKYGYRFTVDGLATALSAEGILPFVTKQPVFCDVLCIPPSATNP